MLKLDNITKTYKIGDTKTTALDGVSLDFGECEFVSILGASGSGKTTLLNVIGGLDKYDNGDLIINGLSTKEYKDRDWDTYRNHSVGFVFQSYNLIPHQSALSNVELALTLSGVSKSERKKRAKEALCAVGLKDHLKKKPSQMSGGQMQRVAIARALVNDPEILLADEPTGALDSDTSVQIMNLLLEISRDRLVIMVTHNPELAENYSTRIVRLKDGKIIEDAPNTPKEITEEVEKPKLASVEKKSKRTSMSFFTAFSLSMNNLMTKKARTILTSFAGSIGIIGIALILAISNGVQCYIDKVQEDTLSGYPITIMEENVDFQELIETISGKTKPGEHKLDKVYASSHIFDMFDTMNNMETSTNNLKDFKKYLDKNKDINEHISAIQYSYNLNLLIYGKDVNGNICKINPSTVIESMQSAMGMSVTTTQNSMYGKMSQNSMQVWSEIMPARDGGLVNDLVREQYDIIGNWPKSADEVVLIMDENNEISDIYLYSLGLKDQSEIEDIVTGKAKKSKKQESWDYDEIIGKTFYAVSPAASYSDADNKGVWSDMSENEDYMKIVSESGIKLKISGIIKPAESATSTSLKGAIGYTYALTEKLIKETNNADIVKQQKENPETDVFTGLPFETGETKELSNEEKATAFTEYANSLDTKAKAELYKKIVSTISPKDLTAQVEAQMANYTDRASKEKVIAEAYAKSSGADADTISGYIKDMSDEDLDKSLNEMISTSISVKYAETVMAQVSAIPDEQLAGALTAELAKKDMLTYYYDTFMPAAYSESTYEDNIKALSAVDLESPSAISIYAVSFQSKDNIAEIISDYNKGVSEENKITYTDYVGILMSSVTTIVNAISYVLIAFVSISLVVSSIMIGIITYISVLERTKEIGILRAIGASKKDISRVFNAETLIIGLAAGILGIALTEVLCIPINIIISNLTDISAAAVLPWQAAIILVAISILLTIISGLIPSGMAAKKDPVTSLRSE